MVKKNIKYHQAVEELRTILDDLESSKIGVDELSVKVKRAAELIRLCKNKIYNTDMEVKNIVKELETELPAGKNTKNEDENMFSSDEN